MAWICDKNGQHRCEVKNISYNGVFMDVSSITATVESASPISFAIGDYIEWDYDGLRYTLDTASGVEKQARSGSIGKAFVYENLVFLSPLNAAGHVDFLDVVLGNTNDFLTNTEFSFYGTAWDYAKRLEANLCRLYGAGSWKVRIWTGGTCYDNAPATGIDTGSWENKLVDVSGIKCLAGFQQIYELWGCAYVFSVDNGVNYVDFYDDFEQYAKAWKVGGVDKIFAYGKGNGLYKIRHTPDADHVLVTRLRAYGSSDNLPANYYLNSPDYHVDGNESSELAISRLMLPASQWTKGGVKGPVNAYLEQNTALYGVREASVCWDGSDPELGEIKPSIYGLTIQDLLDLMVAGTTYRPVASKWPDTSQRIDKIITGAAPADNGAAAEAGYDFTVVESSGSLSAHDFGATRANRDIEFNDLVMGSTPSVSHLAEFRIVPTSTNKKAVSFDIPGDVASIVSVVTAYLTPYVNGVKVEDATFPCAVSQETISINIGGVIYTKRYNISLLDASENPIVFSTMLTGEVTFRIRAHIEFSPDTTSGFDVLRNEYAVSFDLLRGNKSIDKFFSVTIPQVGFDLAAAVSGSAKLCMRSGANQPREFQIVPSSVRYVDSSDTWYLRCKRSVDQSTRTYFPNSDAVIATGDEYYITGIAMPSLYVEIAARKLLVAATAWLERQSKPRMLSSVEVDNKIMAVEGIVLKEGMSLPISDTDLDITPQNQESRVIDNIRIEEGSNSVRTFTITLRDKKEKSSLDAAIRGATSNFATNSSVSEALRSVESHDHGSLSGRDMPNQHPISSVTGLENALASLVFFEKVASRNVVKLKDEFEGLEIKGYMSVGGINSEEETPGTVQYLDDLEDVEISNEQDGDMLVFDEDEGVFVNMPKEDALSGYAKTANVYTKSQADSTFVKPGGLKTINSQSLVGSGDITIQDGEDGKSAYQIWLDEGNVGSEADFLASLKGDPGSSQAYPFSLVSGFVGGNDVAPTAEDVKQLKLQHDALAEKVVPPPVDALLYELANVNFFDPNDPDVEIGKFLSDAYGNTGTNSNYLVSGYIPFTPSMGKLIVSVNGYDMSESGGYIVLYDSDKNPIAGYQESAVGGVVAWEEKVAFARFSVMGYDRGNIQIEVGDTITAYKSPRTKYLAPSVVVDGSSIKAGTVTGEKVATGTVSPEKCTFFKANLFNPEDEDVEIGKFLDYNGELQTNSNFLVTGYIPFTSGKMCASVNGQDGAGGGFLVLYDANKDIVAKYQGNLVDNIAEWEPGVAFVRFSLEGYSLGNIQVEVGDTITDYTPYGSYALDPNIKVTSELPDGAVTTPKIANASVTPQKCTFFKYNLFDPNDEDVEPGMFLYGDGSLHENSSYITTGFIPFTSGKLCASINGQSGGGGGYVVLFGPDKTTVINSFSGASCNNVVEWEEGVAYVRFSPSGYTGPTDKIQVEPGDTITDYMPYGEAALDPQYSHDKQQYESLLGEDAGRVTAASLTNGQYLILPDFPQYIKKGVCLSMHADITTFNTIYFGKGYSVQESGLYYCGQWLKIDNSNITVQLLYESTSEPAVVQHGLTISGFIRVSMSLDNHGTIHVVLNTVGGMFQHDFENMTFDMANSPFVMSYGSTLTNVKLNATCIDFRCPVWAMGDSYFGVNRGRWPGWMKEFGYFNFLLNGYPGLGSHQAVPDLLRMLNFGTPKYLLWMLGMNDAYIAYEYNFNEVKAICQRKGITLIAATIPTVPTRDKESICSLVRSSGYRYIDCYKAVGADSSGNWYPGFLDVDGVHPDIKGAQALATQVLIDFPELMQYGIVD